MERDDRKGDESTPGTRRDMRDRVWSSGWALWYDVRAKVSYMQVCTNWDQDWRIGGFPFARWNIKDSQDVRWNVGILEDAQVNGGGDRSTRLKCRLLNVHSTIKEAF